jgi:predicted enzyme related to lactoylglutathione lyase
MPTRTTAWPEGTPCWIDYGAADIEAAKAFYANLLGWTYSGGEPEYGGYLNCLLEGKQAAGMGPQQDPDDPPRWTTYFATQDAEAAAARITESGGTVIVPPMNIGPMGRMVIALDPQHNPFGLWEAGEHTGVQIYTSRAPWCGTRRLSRTLIAAGRSTPRSSAGTTTRCRTPAVTPRSPWRIDRSAASAVTRTDPRRAGERASPLRRRTLRWRR